jgi:hypothetical protein
MGDFAGSARVATTATATPTLRSRVVVRDERLKVVRRRGRRRFRLLDVPLDRTIARSASGWARVTLQVDGAPIRIDFVTPPRSLCRYLGARRARNRFLAAVRAAHSVEG